MEDLAIIPGATDADIAAWLGERLATAFAATPGAVAIAVPGGSTPFPIFALLATRDLPWSRLEIWPTDDRCVPFDHAASNTGKLKALFDPLGARVVALEDDLVPPAFALVWLGMGADGHIASLFPNTDPQPLDPLPIRRLTPDPLPPEAPFDRITLTIPALVACGEMLFVMRGDDKRAVLDAAIAGKSDLPIARLLRASRGQVTCFT